MKEKPLKCYVLMIAKHFPATHPRRGEPTFFKEKIWGNYNKHKFVEEFGAHAIPKIHTIRENYFIWERRIKEVQDGRAYLSLREWEGKPYNSKQIEFLRLNAANGVGIEKATFAPNDTSIQTRYKMESYAHNYDFAKNDGLSTVDFIDWFHPVPTELMAIIHFTPFRYL